MLSSAHPFFRSTIGRRDGALVRHRARDDDRVPMREDCRHFESRTYASGEVARFCVLRLAPEAPWRCPADCSHYEPTVIDGTFQAGSLVRPAVEDEPDEPPPTSKWSSPTPKPSSRPPTRRDPRRRGFDAEPSRRSPGDGGATRAAVWTAATVADHRSDNAH
jgi:hypothetical protein